MNDWSPMLPPLPADEHPGSSIPTNDAVRDDKELRRGVSEITSRRTGNGFRLFPTF
jgi:hypothetical protein